MTLTHGFTKHPLYFRWRGINYRCNSPSSKNYEKYGGRGIKICQEWQSNPRAFFEWALANGYSRELQIDRIDNDGPYAPWNCHFVTNKINSRKDRRKLEHRGKVGCLSELAEIFAPQFTYNMVLNRFRKGWSLEEVFTWPLNKPRQPRPKKPKLPKEKKPQVRGSKCASARMTEEDVLLIRKLWTEGWSQRQLAKRFGFPGKASALWKIVHRKSWTHI